MRMNRTDFHQRFECTGPVVTPVIHVLDVEQTSHNIEIALDAGVAGIFLINHDFAVEPFLPIVKTIRQRYPEMNPAGSKGLWMGWNVFWWNLF